MDTPIGGRGRTHQQKQRAWLLAFTVPLGAVCRSDCAPSRAAKLTPLTVLVSAALRAQRDGSGGSRRSISCVSGNLLTRISTFYPWVFLIVAMGKSSCR
jgi:hypothetical protein